MEVGRIARQDDHSAGRIRLQLICIELIAQANIEDAGNDRVYPVLRVLVWHQLHTARHLDPGHVRAFIRRLAYDNGETHGRREGCERLPIDILGQDGLENVLPWLMQLIPFIYCLCAKCCLFMCHRILRKLVVRLYRCPDQSVAKWFIDVRFTHRRLLNHSFIPVLT